LQTLSAGNAGRHLLRQISMGGPGGGASRRRLLQSTCRIASGNGRYMYGMLLLLHVLGATIWTGGHIILSTVVLPKVLRERSVEQLLAFESRYERIGMPALLVQIVTGLLLAQRMLPDLASWFDMSNPAAHGILAKLGLLALTAGFALHARLRVLPTLSARSLVVMAWHIVPVTLIAVALVVVGVSFRTGWLY
ncbi:MAG: CopD family protein, partial [Parahaliea sp.]